MGNELAVFARDLQASLSASPQSRYIATFARGSLLAAQVINGSILGRVPAHRTWVDGHEGAPLDTVKLNGGVIEFEFEFIDPALLRWISEMLREFSPVGSGSRDAHPGLYRRSHILVADGVEVDPYGELPLAKEFVFINTQPYARAIERGLSPQRPEGVYQAVAVLAQRKSNIDIRYERRPLADTQKWTGAQPAIIVQGFV